MIYKGIMGEDELNILRNKFEKIYRYTSRGGSIHELVGEKLEELDIEPEIYNLILSVKNTGEYPVLVLNSNSLQSIATGFYIFSKENLSEMLKKTISEEDRFNSAVQNNALHIVNTLGVSTGSVENYESKRGTYIYTVSSRDYWGNFDDSVRTMSHIQELLQKNNSISDFHSGSLLTERHNIIAVEKFQKSFAAGLKPVMFIFILENKFKIVTLINTGKTLNQINTTHNFKTNLGDINFSLSNRFVKTYRFTPKLKFKGDFKPPEFDKLVEPDAQSLLIKKVRRYSFNRVKDIGQNKGFFIKLQDLFLNGKVAIDKNFSNPNASIMKNMYLILLSEQDDAIENARKRIELINRGHRQLPNNVEIRIEAAITKSIIAYQEAWGSYKPIDRDFFTATASQKLRVKELFFNILYAYIDKALGGWISHAGTRTFSPKTSDSTLQKSSPLSPLTDDEENMFKYLNRQKYEDIESEIWVRYFEFIEKFMRERRITTAPEAWIQQVPLNRNRGARSNLKKQGFSVSPYEGHNDIYLLSMIGIDDKSTIQSRVKREFLLGYDVPDVIARNMYQYFIIIDKKNMDINVIRPSLVDDSTQFKINFQDWDIRLDLMKLINNLISKPKDLLEEGEAGLSKPATPAEKSLAFLSDSELRGKGVVDHPLTLNYDPLRFNRVTRQRSGHLFFENTDGRLVIFPFDSFYHDIEGQGIRSIDVCFTSVADITDMKLFFMMLDSLLPDFEKWLEGNKLEIEEIWKKDRTNYSLFKSLTPPMTPTVFSARIKSAIQKRLEGWSFSNSSGARAACVYVPPFDKGFFSSGDVGITIGSAPQKGRQPFPFDWEVFDRFARQGETAVTGLTIQSHNREEYIDPLFLGEIERIDESYVEWIPHLWDGSTPYDVAAYFIEKTDGKEFIEAIFGYFIRNGQTINAFNQMKRDEMKKYLKDNPNALQLKKIARRNMSRQ